MSGAFKDQFHAEDAGPALINAEAELSLLSDMLADNRLIDLVAERCRGRDFAVPLYGRIFDQIVDQAATGNAVDAVTLAPHFRGEEDWPRAFARLSAAFLNAGSRDQTKAYLAQITTLSSRRRMVAGLQDVVLSASNLSVTREELLVNADEAVAELAEQVERAQASVGHYAQIVIDSFGKPIIGVRCGIIGSLDDAVGVLRPSDLIVVGGRPGMGKTSLVTSYAIGAAARGHPVLIFSLEMSADQLTRRMLADITLTPAGGVPYEQIRDGTVRGANLDAVREAQRRFDELPIEINETPGLTLSKLIRQARSHKRRLAAQGERLELVIVDYLQLMAHSRRGLSPYEHASEVSTGLKMFAKAENLTVMAVAQLSRDLERRPNKRPMPSDLRDSGQIEQDADVILFVYREEEYLKQAEPPDQFGPKYEAWRTEMEAVRNKIEFLVPKRRTGSTGRALGWFFGANGAVRGSDFYRSGGGQ
jgi:replicative DNA helicase